MVVYCLYVADATLFFELRLHPADQGRTSGTRGRQPRSLQLVNRACAGWDVRSVP